MTDANKQIIGFILTLVGAGLGTTVVAAVLQWRFGKQLERLKAVLERGSRIHERQVEALLGIYSKLEAATFYLQRAASTGLLEGENRDELRKRAGEELALASAEYARNKLLLSETLIKKLDKFFNETLSAGLFLRFATDPKMADSPVCAESWQQAREKVYRQLPTILGALRTEARDVIHGDGAGSAA